MRASNALGKTSLPQHCPPGAPAGHSTATWVVRALNLGSGQDGERTELCEGRSLCLRGGGPHNVSQTHTSFCGPFLSTTTCPCTSGLGPGTGAPLLRGLPASYSPPQIKAWNKEPPPWPLGHTMVASVVPGVGVGVRGNPTQLWAPSAWWEKGGGEGERGSRQGCTGVWGGKNHEDRKPGLDRT